MDDIEATRAEIVFAWIVFLLIMKNVVLLILLAVLRRRAGVFQAPEDVEQFHGQQYVNENDDWSLSGRVNRCLRNDAEYVPYFLVLYMILFWTWEETSTPPYIQYNHILARTVTYGASYDPVSSSNSLFKIDPLSGKFTLFTPLTNYKAYDVTYDFIHKIFYVFGSEATLEKEAALSVAIVNPFNGTKKYRTITTERYAELFGLRVDSSTGKLYSVQMDDALENPTSIVQIDPSNFIAKRWVNISKASGVQPDSMAIFFNSTVHQYFVTVPYDSDYLVGIDVIKRKIISEITNSNLPAYLCYDNKTNAFYGMEIFQTERGCRLVRLNPYNGTMEILSKDFKDYEPSTGACHEGYYFTMIVEGLDKQNIVTFDLSNKAKIIANKPAQEYLDSFAFVPL
ncbi:unnamed protein product [Rotaria sp. Silwood1]|nr:unnamed protein product [Rotaria sp. Silwood1]CAF1636505.1 unnamed protein product [Rotaria sp. Silwood1]CAF3622527.1 unnamed protein product [Rotaria sp. Silwood1]CAF3852427.1 unnamed protein product [Rotaria sp. Silwood1]